MKSIVLFRTSKTKSVYSWVFAIVALFIFQTSIAQTQPSNVSSTSQEGITVKGIVTDGTLPLRDVNVIQKGTRNGTVTDEKGEFTFPVALRNGDVLLFSYLGYETQMVTITNETSFITMALTEDLIEMIGAVDTGVPYKSKRKKKN